jgi:DNA-binding MarR family transcriptional regulator
MTETSMPLLLGWLSLAVIGFCVYQVIVHARSHVAFTAQVITPSQMEVFKMSGKELATALNQSFRSPREWRVLTVITHAAPKAVYGYELIDQAKIDAGNLYPTLRRLEKKGLLVSQWVASTSGPRRRMYNLQEEVAHDVIEFVRRHLFSQPTPRPPTRKMELA